MRADGPLRILAFVSKAIGRACLRAVRELDPDDHLHVIAMDPGSDETLALMAQLGVAGGRYSATAIEELRTGPRWDWLLNLWGGHIFRPALLHKADRSLNIHPSLLPVGRGRDPVVWALREGQPAGVSLHVIAPGVDEGDVWYQEAVPYAPNETGGVVYERVVEACQRVFCQQWPSLRAGRLEPTPQGTGPAARRRKELLADRELDLAGDPEAARVVRTLLAHDFGPAYCALVTLDGRRYRARLVLEAEDPSLAPKKQIDHMVDSPRQR